MSEHLPNKTTENFEHKNENSPTNAHEREISKNEDIRENTERSTDELEKIRINADKEAMSADEILRATNDESKTQENEPNLISHELKEIAYQRLLRRTRRHLSPYSSAVSKIIHQPGVDGISEVVGKTVGRPSGIIGGGLLALVGTSIYYYLSRHYSYSYNSFIFLLLMAVGFVLGWSIEVIYKMAKNVTKK